MTCVTSRFASPTATALGAHEEHLRGFSERITHLLSVEAELSRIARGKSFVIYHSPMWHMLAGEADMVIVDLASWALGFYEKGGGFLRKLQGPDLRALGLNWKHDGSSVIWVEDDAGAEAEATLLSPEVPRRDASIAAIERRSREENSAWRKNAFDRLFPEGTNGSIRNVPCMQDINALCERLATGFQLLHADRDQHRAHRYEKGPKTAKMLSLEDVTKHLEACQSLLADLRCLSSNTQFTSYRYKPKAHEDDRHAQDVVDLILLGSLRTIIDGGPNETANAGQFWWQKRTAHYGRLHAAHDTCGDPAAPFNDRSREMGT
jgi:hypothetical protein